MGVKKNTLLSVAEKNKIYKLYKQHHFTKQELANEFNCTLSAVKRLISNFDSPLTQQRLQAKKTGFTEPLGYAGERWKKVLYPTRTVYEVSSLGRMRSYFSDPEKPTIIKGVIQLGYLFLDYFNTEENRRIKVPFHVAVADHFLQKKTSEHNRVIHLDYKKANNRAANLKWVTQDEFTDHLNKNPSTITAREIINANKTKGAKLTLTQVERIRKLLTDPARKITKERIAAMYHITPMTVYRIQSGELWGGKGTAIPYSKKEPVTLQPQTIRAIKKKLVDKDAVQAHIAREFGLSPTVINRIKKGLTYKTV